MLTLLFRVIHVLSGVLWTGFVVFMAAFLVPGIRGAGPAGGAVMDQIIRVRRLPIYMMTLAFLTVLSGIGLYWRDSGGFTNEWARTWQGTTFSIGGALGIIAMIFGGAVVAPAAKKAGDLSGSFQQLGGPPSADQMAEMQRLQARVGMGTRVVAVLLVLGATCMAIARYV